MTLSVKHATISGVQDSGDGKLSSNAWNEAHTLTGTANYLAGFDGTGNGTAIDPATLVVGAAAQQVATRTALAALSTTAPVAYLRESGREGTFVWSSSNNAANVTADTQQGIYVAPASDTSGASGAWVRRYSGPMDIRWFGAVANCTAVGVGTDCSSAINAAAAVGLLLSKSAEILIPKSEFGFRCASTITFTAGVKLKGEGYHANPGQVGATSYTAPSGLRGSMLVFDASTAGLQFIDFTDNAANAAAYEYESSSGSVVSDLRLYGGGGTSTTAHGVEVRTFVDFRNVNIMKFGGNGLYIVANTAGANPYGNASNSLFSHVLLLSNGCHGAHISGIDSNIITFMACHFADNGGAGVFDQSYVGGNNYDGCQFATNNASFGAGTAQTTKVQADSAFLAASASNGSIICDNTSNTPHVFKGTYVEGGNGSKAYLPRGCLVSAGLLAEANYLIATSAPMIFNPAADTIASDTINFKNAQQAQTFATLSSSGLELSVANDPIKINSTNSSGAKLTFKDNGTIRAYLGGDAVSGQDFAAYNSDGVMGYALYSAANGRLFETKGGIVTRTAAARFGITTGAQVFYDATNGGSFTGGGSSYDLNLANKTGAIALRIPTGTQDTDLLGQLKFSGTAIFSAAGVLQAAGFPALTGDVTTSAGALATTIAANAVTYAKFNQVAASSLVGNPTGSLANAQGITLAADHAFSGTTLQLGAFTGDITKSAGSLATTVANNAVTYAKMQDVSATQRVIGRNTAGAGDPEEVTASQVLDWIGATQGQVLYRGAAGWSVLATGTSGQFLKTQGAAANPVWADAVIGVTTANGVSASLASGNLTFTLGAITPSSVASTGAVTSSSATAGIGYATGAGGAVTQLTSKSTAPPAINKVCGQITMNNAALAAGAKVTFTVSNTACAATDGPYVWVVSGGTANAYRASVTAVAANSFSVTVENITAGSLSEAPVIGFFINKAVTS